MFAEFRLTSGPERNVTGLSSRQRSKRAQVVRACDSCRKHRIKCDNHTPCTNCKTRGASCSNVAAQSISLPHAQREIERLRQKVEELEQQLQQTHDTAPRNIPNPPLPQNVGWRQAVPQWSLDGIHVRPARCTHETWYGASSLYYFIGQMSNFLNMSFPQIPSPEHNLESNPASALLDGPGSTGSTRREGVQQSVEGPGENEFLSLMQEGYFIDLYWQSYHSSIFPIVDEAEFKEYYRSLWTAGGDIRSPSALVDIIVALCMQHGVSLKPTTRQGLIGDADRDAAVAGRAYYLRCQRLLSYELETPRLSTLQCQLLCAVYLCCGTFQNMMDSVCGMAVRTAYMLGLHIEPPDTMPQKERELRKRLWWALYILETKIGMKLGRPFLLHQSNASPALPSDHLEVAMHSGSMFSPLGENLSWLSFHRQHAKLFLASRDAHTAFYSVTVPLDEGSETPALEKQAELWAPHIAGMDEWAQAVPGALRTARKSPGQSLSTDRSDLDIEQFAPLWLQRQRLLLELMYHNLCLSLYRPFIVFGSTETSNNTVSQMAERCANHAMALTKVTQQALAFSGILTGWHEAFQWQWNAAMTLVGYVLAFPQSEEARKSIDASIAVLDVFGDGLTVATSAANIVRRLSAHIDVLMQKPAGQAWQTGGAEVGLGPSMANTGVGLGGGFGFDDIPNASMQDVFSMAFDVDQWNNLDMLWPNVGERS